MNKKLPEWATEFPDMECRHCKNVVEPFSIDYLLGSSTTFEISYDCPGCCEWIAKWKYKGNTWTFKATVQESYYLGGLASYQSVTPLPQSNTYLPMGTYPSPSLKAPESSYDKPLFSTEPILGFRLWNVDLKTERVMSMNTGQVWLPGRRFKAYCIRPESTQLGFSTPYGYQTHAEGEEAPALNCACGIYAHKPEHYSRPWQYAGAEKCNAWGLVNLWGKIYEHSAGYKAQYAYPKELATTKAEVAEFLSDYFPGIPVHVVDRFGYMPAHWRKW